MQDHEGHQDPRVVVFELLGRTVWSARYCLICAVPGVCPVTRAGRSYHPLPDVPLSACDRARRLWLHRPLQ